jgi:hypothetical protein
MGFLEGGCDTNSIFGQQAAYRVPVFRTKLFQCICKYAAMDSCICRALWLYLNRRRYQLSSGVCRSRAGLAQDLADSIALPRSLWGEAHLDTVVSMRFQCLVIVTFWNGSLG